MFGHRASDWDERYEDEWETKGYKEKVRHVRPGRVSQDYGYPHRTTDHLIPEVHTYSTGLHRTKSTGHAPQPNVTIINSTDAHPNVHAEQRSPLPSPLLYPQERGRSRRMPGGFGDVEDELAELRLEIQKQRSRSRSDVHNYHHGSHSPSHDKERWELEAARRRLQEEQDKRDQKQREELIKRKLESQYMTDRLKHEEEEARIKAEENRYRSEWELKAEREELKRIRRDKEEAEERKRIIEAERYKMEKEQRQREEREREKKEEEKRIIQENIAKLEKQAREAREAEQRAVDEYNRKKAEKDRKDQEEKARIVAEFKAKESADAAKAKKQREELAMQIRIEEENAKRKEKEEYDRFLLKQKQIAQEEKEKKEKKEAELEDEMRKRLAQFGFQDNQIKAMIRPEEAAKLQQGMTPHNPARLSLGHPTPTYVKVHRNHLDIETLRYYEIPYETDRTNPDYIIIMQEMDPRETEILFEHTRRLRSRGTSSLLIEERVDSRGKNDYAWVRRKSQSRKPSRSPSRTRKASPRRVVGIKEMFY